MKKCLLLIYLCSFFITGNAQLERFVYDLETSFGELDTAKLISLLPKDKEKNIFFISEMDHRQNTIDNVKATIFRGLIKALDIDYLFFEFPIVDYYAFRCLVQNRYTVNEILKHQEVVFKQPIFFKDSNDIKHEVSYFNRQYFNKIGSSVIQIPIDIAASQPQFSISALCYLTKRNNVKRIIEIDRFSDSIMFDHRLVFHQILFTDISDELYNRSLGNFERFIKLLRENYPDADTLFYAWKNLFYELSNKYFGKNHYYTYMKSKKSIDFGLYMRYRDSVMFQNIDGFLKEKGNWQNIIVSASSLHNLNSYKNNPVFAHLMSDQYTTLGDYLVNRYKEKVKQIAIVCQKCDGRNFADIDKSDKKNRKKSIEWKLGKKYNYAYVSLSDLRSDDKMKDFEFYFRPTFREVVKAKWQNIYDGILFIRNCECE